MFPLIAALVLIAARLPAQQPERYAIEPLVSQLAEGYIDWTQHALFAYGDGTAPAAITDPVQQRLHGLRNARDEAFSNMRQLIGQVRLNADTQLQDASPDRDFRELARVAIGSQSEDQGHYRIAVRMLLLGDFAAAVLPEVEPIDPRLHDLSHFDDFPTVPATADSLTTPATADSLAVPANRRRFADIHQCHRRFAAPATADSLEMPIPPIHSQCQIPPIHSQHQPPPIHSQQMNLCFSCPKHPTPVCSSTSAALGYNQA